MKRLIFALVFVFVFSLYCYAEDFLVLYHYPQEEVRISITELGGLQTVPIYDVQWQEMNAKDAENFIKGQWSENKENYRIIDVYKIAGKVVIEDHITKTDKFIQVKVTDTEIHDYTVGNME